MLTVDALAQEIRRVDGSHSLAAGALAEALLPFISAALAAAPREAVAWVDPKDLEYLTRRNAYNTLLFRDEQDGYVPLFTHPVQQGWRLVPEEPTEAMKRAGGLAILPDTASLIVTGNEAADAYRAMLAASPKEGNSNG
jgi:hypothetical protein